MFEVRMCVVKRKILHIQHIFYQATKRYLATYVAFSSSIKIEILHKIT